MKQSKMDSFLETFTNIAIGMCFALLTQILWFPVLGHTFTMAENVLTTVVFTAVSFIRMYVIRRAFDGRSVYQFITNRTTL